MDKATKFIPAWVKVAVALALGMGTMVGWKRIVVTVGEKIGKEHLTYAQGACAELVAMGTIFAADNFGLPVSYHARAELGRGGHHGGQQQRLADVDDSQYRRGVGLYAAGGGAALGIAVLAVPAGYALRLLDLAAFEGVRRCRAPFFLCCTAATDVDRTRRAAPHPVPY